MSRLAAAQGCLTARLARPCGQLSTFPCGRVCGQALRGDGQTVMDRRACMPLGLGLPLSWPLRPWADRSVASFALAVAESWASPWRPSLDGGGWSSGSLRPAGDEDVACVLSLASLACGRPSCLTHHQQSSEQKGTAVCAASGSCCVTAVGVGRGGVGGRRDRATAHSSPRAGSVCPADELSVHGGPP